MKRVFSGVVVLVVLAFGIFMWQDVQNDLAGNNSLPQDIDMAYKEIQARGIPSVPRYVVVDTAGYNYFVAEEKFETILVPQKIGEALYRLPNGSLLTSLP